MKERLRELADEIDYNAEYLGDPNIQVAAKLRKLSEEGVRLHTLTYDCRDYYCDGMHLVGVFGSQEDAEAAQEAFHEQYPLQAKSADFTIGTIEIGKLYDGS